MPETVDPEGFGGEPTRAAQVLSSPTRGIGVVGRRLRRTDLIQRGPVPETRGRVFQRHQVVGTAPSTPAGTSDFLALQLPTASSPNCGCRWAVGCVRLD